MSLGLLLGIGKAFRKKSIASLNILTAKTGPRSFYKGKNCKPTGFHTRKAEAICISVCKRNSNCGGC